MYLTSVLSDLSALVEAREHDDDGHVLLPDHAPEVVLGALQRALSRDELTLGVVALKPRRAHYKAGITTGCSPT